MLPPRAHAPSPPSGHPVPCGAGLKTDAGPDSDAIVLAVRATGGASMDIWNALTTAGVAPEMALPLAGFLDPGTASSRLLHGEGLAGPDYQIEVRVEPALAALPRPELQAALTAVHATGEVSGSFLLREGAAGELWLCLERGLYDDLGTMALARGIRGPAGRDLVRHALKELEAGINATDRTLASPHERTSVQDLAWALVKSLGEGKACTLLTPGPFAPS